MSGAFGFDSSARWSFVTTVVVGTADYTLVAAPGAGRAIVVQKLCVNITTANAATFAIEDSTTGTDLFAGPASLAVGYYEVDAGPLGVAIGTNQALEWDASAAGIGATVSGYGYYRENV